MSGPDAATTAEHWQAAAAGYDDAKARNPGYAEGVKAIVRTWVPRARDETVLEIGCGTGQVLAALGPRRGTGIDAAPAMIERASARFADRPELSFLVADAAQPAGDEAFDAVVSVDLLEHVPDWPAVVAAAVAACRPGGRIVLATPNPAWAAPLWLLEKLRLKMPEGPHRWVHRRAIAGRLAALGCAVRHVGTHLAVPVRLGGLGPALSAALADVPIGRELGVLQLVVAEKGGDER